MILLSSCNNCSEDSSTESELTGSSTYFATLDIGSEDLNYDLTSHESCEDGSCKCNIWKNDCPENQKCNAYSNSTFWNNRKCVPIFNDPDELNEDCIVEKDIFSGVDSCDVGLICWDVKKDLLGKCVALCSGSSDNPTCPADTVCYMFNDSFNLCLKEF